MGLPGGQGHCQGRPAIRQQPAARLVVQPAPAICPWPCGRSASDATGAIELDLHGRCCPTRRPSRVMRTVWPAVADTQRSRSKTLTLGPAVHAGPGPYATRPKWIQAGPATCTRARPHTAWRSAPADCAPHPKSGWTRKQWAIRWDWTSVISIRASVMPTRLRLQGHRRR